ncbi:class I SAM-dependent methyltransferase [Jannaschia formosa]|uniref:class I SAM-dependent methyltransferase n=1 Tax=Jannaschia formosa TaxID=2259592 RepID=UPI000E1BA3D3|nr:class I SAM-dependent methyltransferase [Jannaschia formosa]TFL17455.1 class I SAM-dependent methyltransferase [Jannaschia formosa]
MSDPETLRVYAEKAGDYAAAFDEKVPRDLRDFAALLPPGGRVLDLGCGPGGMAGWLAAQGFEVEAWDASPEMVAIAARQQGVRARVKAFEDLDGEALFDGIWASFSLLHARRAELPDLVARIARATRPGGAVHIAMKLGEGEGRDALGRFYAYVSEAELTGWLEAGGLTIHVLRTGKAKGLAWTEDPFVTVTARA